MPQLQIRIIGERLPGRRVGPHENVHLGIQKGEDILDLVPGDAPSAVFSIAVGWREGDFRGPWVHGKPGERFLYLVWADVASPSGVPERFARIKVQLDAIPAGLLRADTSGLEAYVALTDDEGKPIVASVRPPKITWSSS